MSEDLLDGLTIRTLEETELVFPRFTSVEYVVDGDAPLVWGIKLLGFLDVSHHFVFLDCGGSRSLPIGFESVSSCLWE